MIKDIKKICDQDTFESIFKTYAKDLRRFIFFKTQDIQLAEDILQDTFIKLWDNCANVNYGKVKPYLYSVATNLFLNKIKKDKIIQKHKDSVSFVSDNQSPEFIMIEQEFLEKLEAAIESLPEKQREVFLLNRIEKKKYKEIAESLEISVKAVEKRMHLALKTMREKIGNI
ncbi:RNA polymerase sigma-70 factor [Winogradskyella sp. 3972H.M.0a.05]|uniref:RNA polymerase sigma factor n=1 Tax=Winogradskyella sp. 3972H.M.0a.05 TaxID=2950277 RepID=UPI003395D74C